MEITENAGIIIDIAEICSVELRMQSCTIHAKTVDGQAIQLYFTNVWDSRYAIENAYIDRTANLSHAEANKSSILAIRNSEYIRYFQKQVSGTRPIEGLINYIVFDRLGSVVEVITKSSPELIEENPN